MTSGVLHDPMAATHQTSAAGPRFRPYASQKHQVTKGRYITSNDPRGYIPVYEYPLNGQWIMMDIDDGYILWTGIWKALGNSKADIVKMIDSQPELASVIRRVRGGYLKIQGTWMPYEVALRLSRRVAWPIRDDLIPLFGPTFPSTCLSPDQAGYGQIVSNATGRRRPRRTNQPAASASASGPQSSLSSWSTSIPVMPGPSTLHLSSASFRSASDPEALPSHTDGYAYPSHRLPQHTDGHQLSPPLRRGYITPPSSSGSPLVRERSTRYSPYPASTIAATRKSSASTSDSISMGFPSITLHDRPSDLSGASSKLPGDQIKLPPIQPLAPPRSIGNPSYALPPISALEDLRGISSQDSTAVLRRLKMDDDRKPDVGTDNIHWSRQRAISTCDAVSRVSNSLSYPIPMPNSWPGQSTYGSNDGGSRAYVYAEQRSTTYRGRSHSSHAPPHAHSDGSDHGSREDIMMSSQHRRPSPGPERSPRVRASHGAGSVGSAGRLSPVPSSPNRPSLPSREEGDTSRRSAPIRTW